MVSFLSLLGLWSIALTIRSQGVTMAQSLRISTYNLRYDSMPDNITVAETLSSLSDPLTPPAYYGDKGEQPWSTRRVKVYQHLDQQGVVLAGKLS